MPPKGKTTHKQKHIFSSDDDEDQLDQMKIHKLQPLFTISSIEADQYLLYLRKKITNKSNNPFDLPFLNLKFQELDSWKDATEQLNLESKIYGMRVDTCHDMSMKLLDWVIRNQQEEIDKDVISSKADDEGTVKGQIKKVYTDQEEKHIMNFNLEKHQKINSTVQIDKNLHNRSLWRTIFKKCQSLQQIQLNTIEISINLALNIDLSTQILSNIQPHPSIFIQDQHEYQKVFEFYELNNLLCSIQRLQIFKQISTVKSHVNSQVDEIILKSSQQKKKKKQYQDDQNGIDIGRSADQQYLYQDKYFADFYGEYQSLQKPKPSKKTQFDDMNGPDYTREDIFQSQPLHYQLHSIPIENITQFQNHNQSYFSDNSSNYLTQLYEPQKDMLFQTVLKKKTKARKQYGRRVHKQNRQQENISFERGGILLRQHVFQKKKASPKMMNENLVPINFVFLYEARNPFKKLRKEKANLRKRTADTIYDIGDQNTYEHAQNFFTDQFISHQPGISHQLGNTQNLYIYQTQKSRPYEHSQQFNATAQKNYKNVSMKIVKNSIKNQIMQQGSILLSKDINHSDSLERNNTSHSAQFQDMDHQIGLKYFRQKMACFDPLDILVSMLHIAYEQQVRLKPIYLNNNSKNQSKRLQIKDILIMNYDIN